MMAIYFEGFGPVGDQKGNMVDVPIKYLLPEEASSS
jgi:hypothetical protein